MGWTIHLNGEPRTIRPETTVAGLLEEIGMNRDGIAVAIDRQVVPRSEHPARTVPDGARVEVIRAVGGG